MAGLKGAPRDVWTSHKREEASSTPTLRRWDALRPGPQPGTGGVSAPLPPPPTPFVLPGTICEPFARSRILQAVCSPALWVC